MNPNTVLIIDDDHSVHEIVEASLSIIGINCIFAFSDEDGLEIVRQNQLGLILMDLLLPGGMKGWEAIAILRAEPTTHHIPILAFTAGTGHFLKQAMQAGASGFITKPFSIKQFQNTVKQHLNTVHR